MCHGPMSDTNCAKIRSYKIYIGDSVFRYLDRICSHIRFILTEYTVPVSDATYLLFSNVTLFVTHVILAQIVRKVQLCIYYKLL